MTAPDDHCSGGVLLGWQVSSSKPSAFAPSPSPSPIWDAGESHLITVAPTGSGKGVSCMIPALLTWPGPAIAIDPKGENYAVTARRRRELGQEVILLDPFDVAGTGSSAALNPLDLLDIASPGASDDANLIATLCMQGRISRIDPYWDERAEALITGLILYVARNGQNELRNLAEVRLILESSYEDEARTACRMRTIRDPDADAASNIFLMEAGITRSGIMANASSHLSFLRNGPVQNSLRQSTLRLEDIQSGAPLTVYLVLPPDRLASHGKLLRLWLGVLMAVLARRRAVPQESTLLLIDEAAQLGPLNALRSAVTLMRGYGVKVWSFWQDLSQLVCTYPEDWQSLLNNCAVQQFFRPASPFAASQLEKYLAGSVPKPLSSLDIKDAVLVRDGRPSIVRRPNYLTDAILRELADPNPRHASTRPKASLREPLDDPSTHTGNIIRFPA